MIVKIFRVLPKSLKVKTYLVVALVVITTIVDLIGVASIMPLVELIQTSEIPDSRINNLIYDFFGNMSDKKFKVVFATLSLIFIVSGVSLKATLVHFQYKISHRIEAYLSSLLFKKYLAFDFSWYKKNHTSKLSKNILTEVSFVIAEAFLPMLKLITDSVFIIFLSIFLFLVNWKITLTTFAIFLVAYALIYGFSRAKILKYGKLRLKLNNKRFMVLEEFISVIKDIKIFHKEDFFVSSFKEVAYKYSDAHATSKTLTFLPKFFIEGLVFISVVLFLLLAVLYEVNIIDYIPVITLYLMAMYKLLPAVQQLIISSSKLRNSVPAVQELNKVITDSNKGETNQEKVLTQRLSDLELEGIHFSFDSENKLFDDLNLKLKMNGFVALVGSSGSGKSTLLDIISGVTLPQKGAVTIDKNNMDRLYNHSDLAYVSQNVFVLDSSFYENVAFGIPYDEIDKQKVKEICQKVQLDNWILDSFDEGYDTKIGQNGSRISGGQRQRIGIARALYTDPKIIILDESTSALNISLELEILGEIKDLSDDTLVLFSSHSLDVLNFAKKILYVNNGCIEEFEGVESFKSSKSYKEYVSKSS